MRKIEMCVVVIYTAIIIVCRPWLHQMLLVVNAYMIMMVALIGFHTLRWLYKIIARAEHRMLAKFETAIETQELIGAELRPIVKPDLTLYPIEAGELKAADEALSQLPPDDNTLVHLVLQAGVIAAEDDLLKLQARLAPFAERYTQLQLDVYRLYSRLQRKLDDMFSWSGRIRARALLARLNQLEPYEARFPNLQDDELQVPPEMDVSARVAARQAVRKSNWERAMAWNNSYNSSNSF